MVLAQPAVLCVCLHVWSNLEIIYKGRPIRGKRDFQGIVYARLEIHTHTHSQWIVNTWCFYYAYCMYVYKVNVYTCVYMSHMCMCLYMHVHVLVHACTCLQRQNKFEIDCKLHGILTMCSKTRELATHDSKAYT